MSERSKINRAAIRQVLADSEEAWHDGWRSYEHPGVLSIPVDVAADLISDLLDRSFSEREQS